MPSGFAIFMQVRARNGEFEGRTRPASCATLARYLSHRLIFLREFSSNPERRGQSEGRGYIYIPLNSYRIYEKELEKSVSIVRTYIRGYFWLISRFI